MKAFRNVLFAALLLMTYSAKSQGWFRPIGDTTVITKILPFPSGGYAAFGYDVSQTLGDVAFYALFDSTGTTTFQRYLDHPSVMYYEFPVESAAPASSGYMLASLCLDTAFNDNDVILVKIDYNGDTLWFKKIRRDITEDQPFSIEHTSDNGYIISGFEHEVMTTNDSLFVLKTDSIGNPQWWYTRLEDGFPWENNMSAKETPDGGFLYSDSDYGVFKLSSSGQLMWNYPGQYLDALPSSDGGCFIASSLLYQSTGGEGIQLKRLDQNGQLVWSHNDTTQDVSPMDIWLNQGKHGELLIYGLQSPTSMNYNSEFFVFRYDTNGTFLHYNEVLTNISCYEFSGGTVTSGNGIVVPLMMGTYYYTGIASPGKLMYLDSLDNLYSNTISGKLYNDINSNCQIESGEGGFDNWLVQANGPYGPFYSFSDTSGQYSMNIGLGNYTVQTFLPPSRIPICPVSPNSYTVAFNSSDSIASGNNFANQYTPGAQDLACTITPLTSVRHNTNVQFRITYRNTGSVTMNGTVSMTHPNNTTWIGSSPSVSGYTPNTAQWNFTNLQPDEFRNIDFTVFVPASFNLGDTLDFITGISPLSSDFYPGDNADTIHPRIIAAYDPNEKTVEPEGYIDSSQVLTYTVYFQNTGNDTAFNIRVEDFISNNLDISSIHLLSSSDFCNYTIEGNRKLVCHFNHIMLPDSGTNEQESHGYFKYSIRPVPGLQASTTIKNTAYIYFDINTPVVTNTTMNIIGTAPLDLGIPVLSSDISMHLYPNPATDEVNIALDGLNSIDKTSVGIYDLSGRMVLQKQLNDNKTIVERGNLESGVYIIRVIQNNKVVASGRIVFL